ILGQILNFLLVGFNDATQLDTEIVQTRDVFLGLLELRLQVLDRFQFQIHSVLQVGDLAAEARLTHPLERAERAQAERKKNQQVGQELLHNQRRLSVGFTVFAFSSPETPPRKRAFHSLKSGQRQVFNSLNETAAAGERQAK